MKTRAVVFRTLLSLAVGGIVFLVAGGWLRPKNPSDSDLVPEKAKIPVASNALWTLLEVTNALYWPDELAERLREILNGTNWDKAVAQDVLGKNRTCLAWFDQSFQLQFGALPGATNLVEEPHLLYVRRISELECIRAAELFYDHHESEAFDLALKVLKFGHRLEDSGGNELHYMLGSAIKSIALRHIRQMTGPTTLPEAELFRILRALDGFGANRPALTNTLKVEYQTESKRLDDFAAGKPEGVGITNSAAEQVAFSNEAKQVYSAGKTRVKFAQTTRALLENISKPYSQIDWPEYSKARTVGLAWFNWIFRGKHNAIGERLFFIDLESLRRLFDRRSQENVNLAATQLLLALKIYVIHQHHLPLSLTELTPEFFARVPLDDFDGQPLRYSRDKKLIYSIGRDLQDSGGQKRPQGDDLPFQISFPAEP